MNRKKTLVITEPQLELIKRYRDGRILLPEVRKALDLGEDQSRRIVKGTYELASVHYSKVRALLAENDRKLALTDAESSADLEASADSIKLHSVAVDRKYLAELDEHRQFYSRCHRLSLLFLAEKLGSREILEGCFPRPGDDYQATFLKDEFYDLEVHRKLLDRCDEYRQLLAADPIKVVVPAVCVWSRAILEFMKSYFGLSKMQLVPTDTSQDAVEHVSGNSDIDFIIAACVTFLMSATERSAAFRFGAAVCRLHQEVVVHGNVNWDSGDQIPMYYLDKATGSLDYLKLADKYPGKILGMPLPCIDDVLTKLECADSAENFLISLWEPVLSQCNAKYKLNASKHKHEHRHLMGFFVNTKRGWRTPGVELRLGDKEMAFYELFNYTAHVSKSMWAAKFPK
jgi:hypothetical protein